MTIAELHPPAKKQKKKVPDDRGKKPSALYEKFSELLTLAKRCFQVVKQRLLIKHAEQKKTLKGKIRLRV